MVDLFSMLGEFIAGVVFEMLPELVCQSWRSSPRISGIETGPIVLRPSASVGAQKQAL